MKTAILILNYNNASDTINCIESVLKFNTAPIKFIVVDNASPDESCVRTIDAWMNRQFKSNYVQIDAMSLFKGSLPNAAFILSHQNDGYAKGNNIGLKFIFEDSEIENVLVLNNDILFIDDIIPQLLNGLYKLPAAGIVSPLLLKRDGIEIDYNCARLDVNITKLSIDFLTLKKQLFPFQLKSKDNALMLKNNPSLIQMEHCEIQLPSGSCMLLNKKYFQHIEGFDPDTFLYYEENILYSKIRRTGKKAYLIPGLKCIHLGAATISKHKRHYEFDKKADRSAWIYFNRYADVSLLDKLFFNTCYSIYKLNRHLINQFKNM